MAQYEKRQERRKQIRWPVHARSGKLHLLGAAACDISPSGIFLQTSPDDPKINDGDRVLITIFPRAFGTGVATSGRVEWSGHSSKHRCDGIGIQFEDKALIRRLIEDARRYEDDSEEDAE